MDNFGSWLQIGLSVLAIATAAGLGLQRGRVGRLQGQLDESDKELAREKARREEAQRDLETYKTDSTAEIARLRTDLAALTRVVTGEAHWVAIGSKLDDHHQEATTHWQHDEDLLAEIRDILTARST